MTDACQNALCFDVRTAANLHSQLMGVLAGFSFLVLATLMSVPDPRRRDRDTEACFTSFVATMVMLLASAFFYAAAAAQQAVTPRAATIVLIAAIDAVLGVLSLFYALTWLASRADFAEAADAIARVTASGITTASLFYVAITATNEMGIAQRRPMLGDRSSIVFYVACGLMVVTSTVIQFIWNWRVFRSIGLKVVALRRPERLLTILAIAVVGATGAAYGVIQQSDPYKAFPIPLLYVLVLATLVYALAMIPFVRAIPAAHQHLATGSHGPQRRVRRNGRAIERRE